VRDPHEPGGRWALPAGAAAREARRALEAAGWRVHLRALGGRAVLLTFVEPGSPPHAGELRDLAAWCRACAAGLPPRRARRRPRAFSRARPATARLEVGFCDCGAFGRVELPAGAAPSVDPEGRSWRAGCDACGDPGGLRVWFGVPHPGATPMHDHDPRRPLDGSCAGRCMADLLSGARAPAPAANGRPRPRAVD
jgi:hypothetical protein